MAEQSWFLHLFNPRTEFRCHLLLHLLENLIHFPGAVKGAAEDQMGQVLRVLQGIRLGQNATARVSQKTNLVESQSLANRFHILSHVLDSVGGRILQFLRASRTTFVNEDDRFFRTSGRR